MPEKRETVCERIYLDDEEFLEFINTFIGELTAEEAKGDIQLLKNKAGYADFAVESDEGGEYVFVEKWQTL